jgi:plastocyanin
MSARRQRYVAGLLAVLCAQAGFAAAVAVKVTTRSGGAVENAVVVFDPLDATPPPSHDSAIIDQINREFVPRVSVVRTGTTVTFPNSDRIRHQVYSFSPAKPINLKLYAGSPETPVVFDHPGLVVLGCNIHDNMVGFVGVVDSPYFAKTSAAGTASLTIPAGHYRLHAWHPNASAAFAAQEVTVEAAALSIALTLAVDGSSAAVAAWPE